MQPSSLIAVLDANVLYPFTLRDTLLRAAAAGLFQAQWSDKILEEATRNLVADHVVTEQQAARLRAAMTAAFPEARVTGFEKLVATMRNDPKDRHVAAAAVKAKAKRNGGRRPAEMSEYQYYEFQAIDRPLTSKQMEELRSFSSRARITATTFVNEYSYGSFKGDADAWMQDYFDAHLYLANWGTHVLMVALPARLLARAAAAPFCVGHSANVIERKGRVVLSFLSEDEDGDGWVDGTGQLSSIIGVRAELERGGLRALYLGWLLCAQKDELGDDDLEPPVPPGLGKLSASGESLVEFLRIDRDLLHVAAQASPDTAETTIELKDARKWLRSIVAEDKDDALARIIANDDPEAGRSLRKRLLAEQQGAAPSPGARRTVRELLDAASAWGEERIKIEARRRAQKKAKEERAAAVAREAHLNALAGREKELWREVDQLLVPTKLPKNYDRAVQILCDLRDLDARKPGGDFSLRLQVLRAAHSSKSSFLKRLNNGGL